MSASISPVKSAAAAVSARASAAEKHGRKAALIKWLRKTHGWIGLWGA
ncbi:MAG: hypothetical protein JWP59_4547, partial [Massilia sp.]|nr:hypothetical protein [Massilia sp.]